MQFPFGNWKLSSPVPIGAGDVVEKHGDCQDWRLVENWEFGEMWPLMKA
jgi:hypothetical protein